MTLSDLGILGSNKLVPSGSGEFDFEYWFPGLSGSQGLKILVVLTKNTEDEKFSGIVRWGEELCNLDLY